MGEVATRGGMSHRRERASTVVREIQPKEFPAPPSNVSQFPPSVAEEHLVSRAVFTRMREPWLLSSALLWFFTSRSHWIESVVYVTDSEPLSHPKPSVYKITPATVFKRQLIKY